jgi:hypothetical protein
MSRQAPSALLLRASLLSAAVCSLGIVLFTVFFPQYWLYKIVSREKGRTLDGLAKQIEALQGGGGGSNSSRMDRLLGIYLRLVVPRLLRSTDKYLWSIQWPSSC